MIEFLGQKVVVEKDFRTQGMSLYVNSNGQVTVKTGYCPDHSEEEIESFVKQHKRFLNNQLVCYSNARLPDLCDGGKVSLLGKEYAVVRNENIHEVALSGKLLKIPLDFSSWQTERFFGDLLLPHVKAMTELYSETYGLKYSEVGLHTWSTAWGTHFGKDHSIKYNIALVFVPEECVEYIVVHELCHSLYLNHSQSFWTEVGRICPKYKENRDILNLYNIGWLFERAKIGKWRF